MSFGRRKGDEDELDVGQLGETFTPFISAQLYAHLKCRIRSPRPRPVAPINLGLSGGFRSVGRGVRKLSGRYEGKTNGWETRVVLHVLVYLLETLPIN